ncbi:hypothetical protein GPECTOR_19g383 [Gonium pectorale]|uniref:Uncharacterized protein n=1 Tax=Gonium pectorale TaxID=33097 RepID=A0A150GJF6_GONPE|nr:hypothetical protein GPECTOR_19g383 [Gonium pectorale]|eukprot:KXZ49932.1 hypothetical protein GPECTOR_19g383 [Gonium pectorale]
MQTVTVVEEPASPLADLDPPPERSSRSSRPQESPKTARFGDTEESPPAEEAAPRPALAAFKSSRSLNRSFGVRRRTSDAGGDEPEPKEETETDAEPDPLREEFEKMKAANPWLTGITQKSMAKSLAGLSNRTSEKSLKSRTSKRPSVGFALKGKGDGDDEDGHSEGTDHSDVDPEQHMEAERIASIVIPRVEMPAPVPTVLAQEQGGEAEAGKAVRAEVAAADGELPGRRRSEGTAQAG